ncbi:cystatin-A [Fukomys damarensis]|uniref:Cystatin-A n=1 Tax=Fukomys damarensis TaxID=885580 RepID=A0A091E6T3_FUKDA|nr:cystatin-A [Fukomys damarensis]KFO38285.1 Cystatin-A [Fukomys damarensis]
MLRGGLSETRPATPEIQKMVDEVKPQLEEKTKASYQEFKAIEYKTQVVQGGIYYIKVQVGNNRYIHIKVMQHLPGQSEKTLELSAYQTDKSKEDELTSFSSRTPEGV